MKDLRAASMIDHVYAGVSKYERLSPCSLVNSRFPYSVNSSPLRGR